MRAYSCCTHTGTNAYSVPCLVGRMGTLLFTTRVTITDRLRASFPDLDKVKQLASQPLTSPYHTPEMYCSVVKAVVDDLFDNSGGLAESVTIPLSVGFVNLNTGRRSCVQSMQGGVARVHDLAKVLGVHMEPPRRLKLA